MVLVSCSSASSLMILFPVDISLLPYTCTAQYVRQRSVHFFLGYFLFCLVKVVLQSILGVAFAADDTGHLMTRTQISVCWVGAPAHATDRTTGLVFSSSPSAIPFFLHSMYYFQSFFLFPASIPHLHSVLSRPACPPPSLPSPPRLQGC